MFVEILVLVLRNSGWIDLGFCYMLLCCG